MFATLRNWRRQRVLRTAEIPEPLWREALELLPFQACILVLNLDMRYYDGWENIIVYPDEFVPGWEWEDDAGVVHTNDAPMAGEAMPGGPVVL